MTRHSAGSGIVSRDRLGKIAEPIDHATQVSGPTPHVLSRIEGIPDAQIMCGLWHQLHQALSPGRGNCLRVPTRLGVDDSPNERGVHTGGLAGFLESVLETKSPLSTFSGCGGPSRHRAIRGSQSAHRIGKPEPSPDGIDPGDHLGKSSWFHATPRAC